jgi:hypothetical protein
MDISSPQAPLHETAQHRVRVPSEIDESGQSRRVLREDLAHSEVPTKR